MSDEPDFERPFEWHCAGCGAPGMQRSCDCVTDVICRCIDGKHEHGVKKGSRNIAPPLAAERNPYAATMTEEQLFDDWWARTGKGLDPDTEDVPWYDKRKGLAQAAFAAAMAQSRNYICDKSYDPTEVTFANGRKVWIRFDECEDPYLHIERVQP